MIVRTQACYVMHERTRKRERERERKENKIKEKKKRKKLKEAECRPQRCGHALTPFSPRHRCALKLKARAATRGGSLTVASSSSRQSTWPTSARYVAVRAARQRGLSSPCPHLGAHWCFFFLARAGPARHCSGHARILQHFRQGAQVCDWRPAGEACCALLSRPATGGRR